MRDRHKKRNRNFGEKKAIIITTIIVMCNHEYNEILVILINTRYEYVFDKCKTEIKSCKTHQVHQ